MDHTVQGLGGDIWHVSNWLDSALCDHVIQVADCYEFKSPPAGSSLRGELRSNEVLPFATADSLLESTSQLLLSKLKPLRDWVAKRYAVSFAHAELYSIERDRPGQHHKRHWDGLVLSNRYEELANGIPARDVSIIAFLNDDFEGGDLLFDRQTVKVKPAIGSAVLFPACYTHPYQTLPVRRGCKYTLHSWLLH